MKSAFECFQHAAKCEEQARQATSDAGRTALLETARQWRALGEGAKASEAEGSRRPIAAVGANSAVRPEGERPRAQRHGKLRQDSQGRSADAAPGRSNERSPPPRAIKD